MTLKYSFYRKIRINTWFLPPFLLTVFRMRLFLRILPWWTSRVLFVLVPFWIPQFLTHVIYFHPPLWLLFAFNVKEQEVWIHSKVKVKVTHLCLTLCNPMDCIVHGILQARLILQAPLEWGTVPFSRGSSWPRNQTGVSCIAGRFLTSWAPREALIHNKGHDSGHSSCPMFRFWNSALTKSLKNRFE